MGLATAIFEEKEPASPKECWTIFRALTRTHKLERYFIVDNAREKGGIVIYPDKTKAESAIGLDVKAHPALYLKIKGCEVIAPARLSADSEEISELAKKLWRRYNAKIVWVGVRER